MTASVPRQDPNTGKSNSVINSFSKQSMKPVPTQTQKHAYTNIKQIFEELIPSILPLLKEQWG